jgi:hypothetical protein
LLDFLALSSRPRNIQRRRAQLRTIRDEQIFPQIGPTSALCRLEENQAILLQLSTAVSKLTLAPPTLAPVVQDAEAEAFKKSFLFRLWRFLHGDASRTRHRLPYAQSAFVPSGKRASVDSARS